jgi:nucleotide-binding universal stress UspA family protein
MKILVPVDRSHRDGTTLHYAKEMARGMNGSIIVIEAVGTMRSLLKAAVHQAEGYVSAVQSGLREEGFEAESAVRKGEPAKVILSFISDLQPDFVVMTTRGRSGMSKVVLGSVAHEVLANSPKPVLLLKEDIEIATPDEDTELQSAYIAAIIWNKRAKGLLSEDEARDELLRLSASGLDRNVLYATYMSYEETGKPVDWLDFDFQLNTLQKFLPDHVQRTEEQSVDSQAA